MTRREFIATVVIASLFVSSPALADDMILLRSSVQKVREKLIVLLHVEDKYKQTRLVEDIQDISTTIDDTLKQALRNRGTSPELKSTLREFRMVWTEFRTTRDSILIPNILSGDPKKIKQAKELARTIQAERFQRMQTLLE